MSVSAPLHMYFVGRRLFEAAELYAVSAAGVDRLRSEADPGLDWHGERGARMELSQVLISRVAEQQPSRELKERFALYVLDRLPDGGFVLDSDDVRRWLKLASDPEDFAPAEPPRPSLAGRLRALLPHA